MTGGSVRPAGDEGSISQVVVGVVLSSRPQPEAIREAISKHETLRERYPRRTEHRATQVSVNPAKGVVEEVSEGELAGFSFDYVNPDGNVRRSMSCRDQILSVVRADCCDLEKVREEAFEEMGLVLPVLEAESSNLTFERLDRFLWDGERSEFRAGILFRDENRWLAPNVFRATDMWHSHHGFFEYFEQPESHRVLHIVEAQTVPGEDAISNGAGVSVVVDVKQSLKISYGVSAPGRENRDMSAADLVGEGNLLRDYLLKMMIKAESVLTELIGEGVCREIGPGGKA